MAFFSGGRSDFFGLDIGTFGMRAVQLRGPGPIKTLDRYGEITLDSTVGTGYDVVDKQGFAQALQRLVKQTGISSKNVAVNIPSQRVFTTIIDIPKMVPAELEKTIRYQAGSYIPTPLDKSKIDWAVIGNSAQAGKVEVLISSAPNDFIESRLALVESAGLNVMAMEPDNMALARAIVAVDATLPQMVLDVGSVSADLVISFGGTPHLVRAIPTGMQNIVRAATQNLGIDVKQAQQFVLKFGLGKDKLEGRVYAAIIGVVDGLIAEIEKSIKFFAERYGNTKLDRIIVTGGASTLPELPLYIANKFGINVKIGNAWRNVNVPAPQQNQAMVVSSHFAVAVGLAERME